MTPHLSKSLLINYRQCPRRLWLEMQDRRALREVRALFGDGGCTQALRKSEEKCLCEIENIHLDCALHTEGMTVIVARLLKDQ